jgi:hypothetical protein
VARLLARHYRRPRQLTLTALMVVLPAEIDTIAARRPRWQIES